MKKNYNIGPRLVLLPLIVYPVTLVLQQVKFHCVRPDNVPDKKGKIYNLGIIFHISE